MTSFSSLRARLVGTVFVAVAPAWALTYLITQKTGTEFPWMGFAVGLAALAAAWFGGERFILKQVRELTKAAKLLASGDLTSRVGLKREKGELGDLARTFDAMASSLEQRVREREHTEKTLVTRSFQQTVVGALGQFAIVTKDFSALFDQAVMLAAQTLEVEYVHIMELQPDEKSLLLRTGTGWKPGLVGQAVIEADPETQPGFTLTAGEPVVVENLLNERRFQGSSFLLEHNVVSGITVVITGQNRPFGILGAHTAQQRKFNEDEVHFLLSIATVLAMAVERSHTESELRKLASFAQLNPNPALELAADGTISYFNAAALKLATSSGAEDPGSLLPPNIKEIVQTCLHTNQTKLSRETHMGQRTLSWSFYSIPDGNVVHCYVEDITERLSLEAQLRHSQKMDSVGQLAAGVAHDFNNMLTVIQGHAGMALARPNLMPELRDAAQAIFFAAERAANLTRQLLMFSRKGLMQPALVDLREIVANMSKMLKRLIGETITLQFEAPPKLPLIKGDVGMLEQVLMNLAVNARDAMPNGGTLWITISQAQIDPHYAQVHPDARPGSFLCLSVKDTGIGMDSTTMSRIFEPFFTTKEIGKGTGLGLATVYGIVKQHEGWIDVTSEPRRGSTFTVYFPARSEPQPAGQMRGVPETKVKGGKETILVVEDEPLLRDMAQTILQDCGYKVVEARSGVHALELWKSHFGGIDLVLTDIVMPEGISGMELAKRLLPAKPTLKIIFASGYSMEELDTDFVWQRNALFLQKPYTAVSLAKAVRDCLDR
jgi:signal transduction histidine kinase/CheY-like chemotaxis protein/HAMP domain-containing protein